MNTQNKENMNAAHLKEQLPELQDKKFIGLNNQQVYSYIRIYYAIYMMITVNALDDEYGDRNIYVKKLDALLNILLRRYKKETQPLEKIEQLYMIFFLLENLDTSHDPEEFLNEGADLIDTFLKENKDTMTPEARYQLLRLIMVEWYGLVEDEETETPSSLTYARNQIKTWASQQQFDGSWKDIPEIQALHRIIITSMNSTIMLDDQYDAQLEKAYIHYCISITEALQTDKKLSTEELNKYITIYYALSRAPLALSGHFTHYHCKLAMLITNQIQYQYEKSDLQLLCQSIYIDNMCMKVSDDIQDELMKNWE